ncbi:MAG: hypothetical protein EU547_07490, partial [Promethearchaeota archaeon]
MSKINRPERPIPKGDISLKEAKYLYVAILTVGVLLAIIHSLLLNLGYINIIVAAFFGFIG